MISARLLVKYEMVMTLGFFIKNADKKRAKNQNVWKLRMKKSPVTNNDENSNQGEIT